MPLEEVKFGAAAETQFTALIHGDTGSGKTRFAASWERPCFLSAENEQGWETIRWMDPATFFEPNRHPKVWKLKKAPDLVEAFNDVKPLIQRGEVKTVVVDSLTFWVEMFYDHLLAQSSTKNQLQVYGSLGDHLRNIRIKFHQLGCNVLWLCLTRHPDKPGALAIPEVKGRQASIFPAGCRYVWYMRNDGSAGFEMRTRMYGNVLARGRDGGRLPDPVKNATYIKLRELFTTMTPESLVDRPEAELIAEAEQPRAEGDADPNLAFPLDGDAPPDLDEPRPNPVPVPRPTAKSPTATKR